MKRALTNQMKNRLFISSLSLVFIANPALADFDYAKYEKSDQYFIDNRVSLKCRGESQRTASDYSLLMSGYTAQKITEKEKEFASKINNITNEKDYCKKYRERYEKAVKRMKNDGIDYAQLADEAIDETFAKRGLQTSNSSSTSKTKSSSDPHTVCLDARDYEGCLKVKSGLGEIVKETCDSDDWCQVAGKGRDRYGFMRPKGWWYKDEGTYISYVNRAQVRRVPHKGQPSRYIALPSKISRYQNYVAPSSTTIGNARTNCTDYGSSINCTTTPATTYTTPSISGGGRVMSYVNVYDCKDNTVAAFRNGKRMSGIYGNWGKWKKYDQSDYSKWFQGVCKNAADLPVKNMKL